MAAYLPFVAMPDTLSRARKVLRKSAPIVSSLARRSGNNEKYDASFSLTVVETLR